MPLKPLTAEEIAELRSKEREASTGPWVAYVNERDGAWYVSRRPGDVTGKKFYIFRMTQGDDAPDALFIPAMRNALPSLLDELERSRGTDHPEREPANYGATALDTLNAAPFTPGGRFLFPRAYNQIHAELTRVRELLKRIRRKGGTYREREACPACDAVEDDDEVITCKPDCELAALLG